MRIWKYKKITELLEELNKNEEQQENNQETLEEKNNNQNQEQEQIPQEENQEQQEDNNQESSSEEQGEKEEQQSNQGENEESPSEEQGEKEEQQSNQGENQESPSEEQGENEESKGNQGENQESSSEEQGENQEQKGNQDENQESPSEEQGKSQGESGGEELGENQQQLGKEQTSGQEVNPSSQQKSDFTQELTDTEKTEQALQKLNEQLKSFKEAMEEVEESNEEEVSNENTSPESDEKTDTQLQKELLQKLKDKLEEYKNQKEQEEQEQSEEKQEQTEEQQDEPEEIKNEFLESLKDLPSFEERSKGTGYSINTEDDREVSEVIIKTLINKFLNQRFRRNNTDLNVRSNSLEKTNGFHKWEIKDVITHLETEQYTKVLQDKYGYDYSNGKDENVPLSFYFDMSGSMSAYSSLLAIIAIELLRKNVKVLVGFNEEVHLQIESIDKLITVKELVDVLEGAGSYYFIEEKLDLIKNNKVNFKLINRDIDYYLISKKAEKVVVFSDFDSLNSVIELSNHCELYYFCFEKMIEKYRLRNFKGFIYPVQDELDLEKGLIKVNEKRFKSLVYLDNPKSLRRR